MKKTFSYQRIYDCLKDSILSGEYTCGEKLPTESELQRAYGVSRITVKKSMEMLHGDGLVERFPGRGTFVTNNTTGPAREAVGLPSPEKGTFTTNTAAGPAREMSSLPSPENGTATTNCAAGSAREAAAFPSAEKKIIGLVMSGFSAFFGQEFIKGVTEEANRQGYCLMAGLSYDSLEEERQIIDRQIACGAQGIIAMPLHDKGVFDVGIAEKAIEQFPMVLADRYLEGIPLPYVGSDHLDAAFQATSYLLELGHKNIGIVSPIPSTTAITEREAGYLKAYAMSDYRVKPSYLVPSLLSGMPGSNTQEAFQADVEYMKSYYQKNPEVTALLCIDSNVMSVCMTAAAELGLKVPQDLSLICFDAFENKLDQNICTHIRQPEKQMGKIAVELLLDAIAGKKEPKHILLPAELAIGNSTAGPRDRVRDGL